MSNVSRIVNTSLHKDRAFHLLKLEVVVVQLISEPNRLPVRTLKPLFRTSPVVSVFTGNELVSNLMAKLQTEKREALHIAGQLYKYAYLYPVDQSVTSVKDDSTLYRMQSEDRWPSQCISPTNLDYSTYLEKKLILKQKLTEYEQDAYDRFSVTYARNWHNLTIKAQEEANIEENYQKDERVVNQGEERTFWHLHRPPPGEPLVMESSIQKRNLNRSELTDIEIIQDLEIRLDVYRRAQKRNRVRSSHSADLIISHMENSSNQDPFLKKNVFNPWSNEHKLVSGNYINKFQLWNSSFDALIRDKSGRDLFRAFLKTEVSTENLSFCEEVTEYKMLPTSHLKDVALRIFKQYIGPTARNEINIDGKTLRIIKDRMVKPDRYTFDPAQNYIYDLMRKDSYCRFLKSHVYTNALKKYSIDRKAGRMSRILTHPLNAHSLHNNRGSMLECTSSDLNLVRSNSMDTLTEVDSIVSPCHTSIASSHTSFDDEHTHRKKASLYRNSSGLNFASVDYEDILDPGEVDQNRHPMNKSKSLTQPRLISIPVKNMSNSFDETALSQPAAPVLKNFPKPKSSKSFTHDEALRTQQLLTK
ncbi:Regulator of G-protein signaling 7 [Oopsacas minuta]|uniref:Regulator of G-protein signaling 7 n=1 Tax=Oopsacas minuta TaxID=111878 RepID=A0AAV7JRM8_9METZ|nr:Regulator of G-protein signaling 7 [Oopsacas minuta]